MILFKHHPPNTYIHTHLLMHICLFVQASVDLRLKMRGCGSVPVIPVTRAACPVNISGGQERRNDSYGWQVEQQQEDQQLPGPLSANLHKSEVKLTPLQL